MGMTREPIYPFEPRTLPQEQSTNIPEDVFANIPDIKFIREQTTNAEKVNLINKISYEINESSKKGQFHAVIREEIQKEIIDLFTSKGYSVEKLPYSRVGYSFGWEQS